MNLFAFCFHFQINFVFMTSFNKQAKMNKKKREKIMFIFIATGFICVDIILTIAMVI